jgi:hypothetical protein
MLLCFTYINKRNLVHYIKTTLNIRQDLPAFGSTFVAKKKKMISFSKCGGAMNPKIA